VRAIVNRKGPKGGYSASPMVRNGVTLPILAINAWSSSPKNARELSRVATEAFRSYIAEEQKANAIPPERRVKLDLVRSANAPRVISGPSIVKPMFVLIIALAATFGLAFALENFRPRAPEVGVHPPALPVVPSERKTA
jgi:hypothetical protein